LGKFFDDEGQSISDVETVLESLGLSLRDKTTKQFRDMGDVLNETMVLWNELGAQGKTLEQSMLANAFAGNRQSEVLKSLMGSQKEYLAALEIEADSLGLTEQRYKIFSDNIEAAKNRFTASLEEMWSKTITPETIINITNLGTKIIGVINSLGGLIPILKAIGAALIVINYQTILSGLGSLVTIIPAVITGLTGITFGLGGVTTALAATTAGTAMATAGISVLVGALVLLIANAGKAKETMVDVYNSFQKNNASNKENQAELKTLADRYDVLANSTTRSIEDNIELLDIQSTLNTKYGALTEGINLYSDAIDGNSVAIEKNIAWIRAKALQEAQDFVNRNKYALEEAKKYLTDATPIQFSSSNLGSYSTQESYDPQQQMEYYGNLIAENEGRTDEAGRKYVEYLREQYELIGDNIAAANKLIIEVEGYQNIINATSDSQDGFNDTLATAKELAEASSAATSDASSSYESLTSILESYNKTKNLTINQAQELINAGYGEALSIDALTGAITIDAVMLRQLAIAKADAAIVALQNQMAIYLETTAIEAQEADLVNNINLWRQRKAAIEGAAADTVSLLTAIGGFGGFSSSGGGGAAASQQVNVDAQEAEIDAINEQIDALHDQQDALKDLLKAYKDIIDAQKEKLRLAKEEDDYQKSLEEKNKELVDIDNELLALQFDNSQEANQKRLELEELRAEKAEEIAELQADRTYDIQMEALDAEYAAYEEWINNQLEGIDRLIEGFNAMIEAIRDVIEALQDMNNQSGGGYGGSSGTSSSSSLPLPPRPGQTGGGSGSGSGGFIYGSGGAISNNSLIEEGFSKGGMGIIPDGHPNDSFPLMAESGEMFMIFNKQQQQQLARGARIPNMGIGVANSGTSSAGITVGDISISVAGNLDKVALGDIKTAVFDVLNSASNQRGKRANALTYSL